MPRHNETNRRPQRDRHKEACKRLRELSIIPVDNSVIINRPVRLGNAAVITASLAKMRDEGHIPPNARLFNRLAFPVLHLGDPKTQLSTGMSLGFAMGRAQQKLAKNGANEGAVEGTIDSVKLTGKGRYIQLMIHSDQLAAERKEIDSISEDLGLERFRKASSRGELALCVGSLRSKASLTERLHIEEHLPAALDEALGGLELPIVFERWQSSQLGLE